jgi:hypothetical protein
MPFVIQAIDATREGSELVVRGRLVEGAYFGPELVRLLTLDGQEYSTHIHSHGMELPEGWPVVPEHRRTVLVLRIPAPAASMNIVSVTGLGTMVPAVQRIDVSDVLREPEFWAIQLDTHFVSEEVDYPAVEWLGVQPEAMEKWYEKRIHSHVLAGTWPYVRVVLPSARYIELEMAGGVEYQDRFWIGDPSGQRRVLLGYHSGHFSLPALRAEEVRWLAEATRADVSNLLWLTATYLQQGADLLPLVTGLATQLPGILPGKAATVAQALHSNREIGDIRWVRDSESGWINNWAYSQRNPSSLLSRLGQEEFAYIRSFFPEDI